MTKRTIPYSTCTVLKDRLHFIKDIQHEVYEATGDRLPHYEIVAYALELLWGLRDQLILQVIKAIARRKKEAAHESYLRRRVENGLEV